MTDVAAGGSKAGGFKSQKLITPKSVRFRRPRFSLRSSRWLRSQRMIGGLPCHWRKCSLSHRLTRTTSSGLTHSLEHRESLVTRTNCLLREFERRTNMRAVMQHDGPFTPAAPILSPLLIPASSLSLSLSSPVCNLFPHRHFNRKRSRESKIHECIHRLSSRSEQARGGRQKGCHQMSGGQASATLPLLPFPPLCCLACCHLAFPLHICLHQRP